MALAQIESHLQVSRWGGLFSVEGTVVVRCWGGKSQGNSGTRKVFMEPKSGVGSGDRLTEQGLSALALVAFEAGKH